MSMLPRRIGWAFALAGVFSLLINSLMLGPSLYMLQFMTVSCRGKTS